MSADRRAAAGVSGVLLGVGLAVTLTLVWWAWQTDTILVATGRTIAGAVRAGLAAGAVAPDGQGGGYVTEGVGGRALQLDAAGVAQAVAGACQRAEPGSTVTVAGATVTWTWPPGAAATAHLAGPVTVGPVAYQTPPAAPPTLTAEVQVPWRLPILPGITWAQTVTQTVTVTLAGEQAPGQFAPYQP